MKKKEKYLLRTAPTKKKIINHGFINFPVSDRVALPLDLHCRASGDTLGWTCSLRRLTRIDRVQQLTSRYQWQTKDLDIICVKVVLSLPESLGT